MSGRLPRRGRHSQATKRGQAASVSTVQSSGGSGGSGHGASSAGVSRLSFVSLSGSVIQPQHGEQLVEWITKPSLSSSSSVTQAHASLPSNAAAKVASSTGSLSTVSPSVTPPSCTEESPELFNHSVGNMLMEDAQQFEWSDFGSQVEKGSTVRLERGGATEGQGTSSHVPPAAACCQVSSIDEEGGDDEVTDYTWVPERREEESEEEEDEEQLQLGRISSKGQLKGSHPIASHHRVPQVQGASDFSLTSKSSLVWAFFNTCAVHCTIAVCNHV